MLICETPEFVPWQPNFSSSGQENPNWTRLTCGGVELSNAITWVEWFDEGEPATQVQLCDSCGIAGCESGGYVHVSRLGTHVLWTPPHVDPSDSFASYQYRASEAVATHGAVAFPVSMWDSSNEGHGLPPAAKFPRTLRRDLFAAWQSEAPILGRWDPPDQLLALALERALAADPSEPSDALENVEALLRWFREEPDGDVDGDLVPVSSGDWKAETLYLDVPDTFDRPVLREWTPLARREARVTPLFGGEFVLVPEPT